MQVSYRLKLSDDYVIEALSKHAARSMSRWLRWTLKILAALGMLALGAIGIYADIAAIVGFAAFMLVLLLSGPRIDYFFMRRRWRKGAQYNDELHLEISEQGISTTSVHFSSTTHWTAYMRAVQFAEGVLLYNAPAHYFWLPDSAIISGASEDARAICRTGVRDYRVT